MNEQVLLIEQCQELLALGVDMSKASMCWSRFKNDPDFSIQAMSKDMFEEQIRNWDTIYTPYDYTIIPTLTLQDILTILPNEIQNHKLESDLKGYIHYVFRSPYRVHNLNAIECSTLLEAAFNMLKWCKENKYI